MFSDGDLVKTNKRVSRLELVNENAMSDGEDDSECNLPGTQTPAEFLLRSIDTHYRNFEKNASDRHKRLFNASVISSSGQTVKP